MTRLRKRSRKTPRSPFPLGDGWFTSAIQGLSKDHPHNLESVLLLLERNFRFHAPVNNDEICQENNKRKKMKTQIDEKLDKDYQNYNYENTIDKLNFK